MALAAAGCDDVAAYGIPPGDAAPDWGVEQDGGAEDGEATSDGSDAGAKVNR